MIKLMSGGAIGADTCWAKAGKRHNCFTYGLTFPGHKVLKPAAPRLVLKGELFLADNELKRVSHILNRSFPCKSKFSTNLLRRNFYQIAPEQLKNFFGVSQAVYAVGYIDKKGNVAGGTAWAIEFAKDKMKLAKNKTSNLYSSISKRHWINVFSPKIGRLEDDLIYPILLFDQNAGQWKRWFDGPSYRPNWRVVDINKFKLNEKCPYSLITAIGSRELTSEGKNAIEEIFKDD